MDVQITHVGFSDESNWNVGRFRSLSLVTAPLEYLDELENELKALLLKSEVGEFKWNKLKGARERFAACNMCRIAIEKARAGKLRVDVLIWDIQDSRHNVLGRDDIANLQRMYYHLFINVLRRRWPNNAVWRLYPDEHTAVDWQTLEDFLEKKEFGLEEIVPATSAERPLLQLADLFAGMAVFSREKFQDYQAWLEAPQSRLSGDTLDVDPSRSEKERFNVLRYFDKICKARKLGVSLEKTQGLWTPKPKNPLNFWIYKPQHPDDKAPTRGELRQKSSKKRS